MNESIKTKIELIEADIANAYTEAEAKGATMPLVQGSANLADTVASIPTGSTPTLITKQITANGTYTAEDDNADGFSEVSVNVPDESKAVIDSLIDKSITAITSDVTRVGGYLFRNDEALTEANFSNVVSIGPYAFSGCSALTEVSFPKLTSISSYAFSGCSALTEVSFPKLTSISSYTFQNCTGLQYFDMSEVVNVPIIEKNTFKSTTCIFLFRDQAQLDEYARATNWSDLPNQFQIKGATA